MDARAESPSSCQVPKPSSGMRAPLGSATESDGTAGAVMRGPCPPPGRVARPVRHHQGMTSSPQPGWYADPAREADLRWWDGARWTDATVQDGAPSVRPLPGRPAAAAEAGVVRVRAAGSLLTEPALVLDPTGEVRGVRSPDGRALGSVVGQLGQGLLDRLRTARLTVRDPAGAPLLLLTRSASLRGAAVVVERPGAGEVGALVPEQGRWALVSAGQPVGGLRVDDAGDVVVADAAGDEVARASAATGERVVRVHRALQDPLLPLALAGALVVTA